MNLIYIFSSKTTFIETFNNNSHLGPFKNILAGAGAFYNQPDYLTVTRNEFAQSQPLSVSYTCNTESKITRIAKQIFSVIFFIIGVYKLLHILIGKTFLPAPTTSLFGQKDTTADVQRLATSLHEEWKYKRFTIEVDGYKIDAAIMGTAQTLNNGKWLLHSNGISSRYEGTLGSSIFKQILSELNSNAIVFNYPGVGASSGPPNKETMIKAYRAMLTFLEDKKNGIGAKEIIGYGFSLGGGIQGEALKTHRLKKDVDYVFVKDRTFSKLNHVIKKSLPILSFLAKILGWDMDSIESSKKLQAPEIIIQSADTDCYILLKNSSRIIHDGVIPAEASIAKTLLDDQTCPKQEKVFIGIPEKHGNKLESTHVITTRINYLLAKQRIQKSQQRIAFTH
jgi:hypothetical protein